MKKIFGFFVLFFLLFQPVSFAEPRLNVHNWDLGFQTSHDTYKEPGIMKEKGLLYGVYGSYTYHERLMFSGDFRFSYGQVDYSSQNTGNIDNIDDYIFEYRFLGGYDLILGRSAGRLTLLTPYLGIGYRYLNDDSGGMVSTTGHSGYERESNYYYSPVGLEADVLYEKWSFGLRAEYDIFWWGLQRSHLSDVGGVLSDVENEQNNGYGWRGSVKVERKFKNLRFLLEPYVIYWDIDKSEVSYVTTTSGYIVGVGWEPDNESTEWGLRVGLRF